MALEGHRLGSRMKILNTFCMNIFDKSGCHVLQLYIYVHFINALPEYIVKFILENFSFICNSVNV